ncbi:hypothetical protein HF923_07520 [Acidithiobacillus ferriphilus]|uniref:hypothetical protein n=1 Tax=Acidithiobacillus ferriphilus TaxID=1689834 RepID=UPI001C07689C|nr:hypothetical protein [Acidithiobacillus ferriphilus]MBU2845670.1 hypothetical protein [Acidithiobacillus ferriphilus]
MKKIQTFGTPKTPAQLYQDRKDRESAIRSDKKHGVISNIRQWLAEMDFKEARKANPKPKPARVVAIHRVPRARRGGEGSRSSAKSGDGNSSDDPDSERRQQSPCLYDQAALADLLKISKKSVQNIYSRTPHLLPQAIQIPGARGPRWTPQAVQLWLENRPQHSSAKPAPKAAKNKVGRPRIALAAVVGVQS